MGQVRISTSDVSLIASNHFQAELGMHWRWGGTFHFWTNFLNEITSEFCNLSLSFRIHIKISFLLKQSHYLSNLQRVLKSGKSNSQIGVYLPSD